MNNKSMMVVMMKISFICKISLPQPQYFSSGVRTISEDDRTRRNMSDDPLICS